ncbi:aldehyde dehydrogenase family protein [Sphaerisporangium sp. NPDC051011]|uniref:aldehyde dehydrogenase family protein n=1 Tax=Sphaerisporangium sp. NPDC051011 TaxID=3155792 RepID=UPI0033FC6144
MTVHTEPIYATTDVADVGRRAHNAQAAYAELSLPARIELLRAWAHAVEQAQPELVDVAADESHLPRPRLEGEVARTASQFRQMAEVLADGAPLEATIDSPNPALVPPRPDLRRVNVAVGPVAVYAASNFPFAFGAAGTDTSSALAAGCVVVVKAHPLQRRTANLSVTLLRRIADAHGLPADVVQVVHGFGAGLALIQDPHIRAGAFTGSTAGGRALFDLASARPDPVPFYGELGSVNPVLVTRAAAATDAEGLASELAGSIAGSSGQLCTRPSLLLVPADSDGDRFATLLAEALTATSPGQMLSDDIAKRYETSVATLSTRAEVRSALGQQENGGPLPALCTVSGADLLADPKPYLEELFGPFALAVRYQNAEELDAILAVLPGSLTFTLRGVAGDPELTPSIVATARLKAGRLLGAGVPTGVSVTEAQMHGGAWPAATSPMHSSVGTLAIRRFLRPVAYQDFPTALLPAELRDGNPLGIARRVDGRWIATHAGLD